jgi:hypothetical protein
MSSYTIEGRALSIGQTEIKSEKFSCLRFVLDDENPKFRNMYEIQLSNKNMELAGKFKAGDLIRVTFDLKGRSWTPKTGGETKYFHTLDAWKIDVLQPQQRASFNEFQTPQYPVDDIAF